MQRDENPTRFLPLAFVTVIFSYFFLDEKIALSVKKLWMADKRLNVLSAGLPDMLSLFVLGVTVAAWTIYLSRTRKDIHDSFSRFSLFVATSLPFAFIGKTVLKILIGRITTRYWLVCPGAEEFLWFHGVGNYGGFPSGHMAVFATLAAAVWRFFPRWRVACYGFLSVLALALIATGYHFLSDVIAGSCLGLIVDHPAARRVFERLEAIGDRDILTWCFSAIGRKSANK